MQALVQVVIDFNSMIINKDVYDGSTVDGAPPLQLLVQQYQHPRQQPQPQQQQKLWSDLSHYKPPPIQKPKPPPKSPIRPKGVRARGSRYEARIYHQVLSRIRNIGQIELGGTNRFHVVNT